MISTQMPTANSKNNYDNINEKNIRDRKRDSNSCRRNWYKTVRGHQVERFQAGFTDTALMRVRRVKVVKRIM